MRMACSILNNKKRRKFLWWWQQQFIHGTAKDVLIFDAWTNMRANSRITILAVRCLVGYGLQKTTCSLRIWPSAVGKVCGENPRATSRYSEHRGPSTNHITCTRPWTRPVHSPSTIILTNHAWLCDIHNCIYYTFPEHIIFPCSAIILGPYCYTKVCPKKGRKRRPLLYPNGSIWFHGSFTMFKN